MLFTVPRGTLLALVFVLGATFGCDCGKSSPSAPEAGARAEEIAKQQRELERLREEHETAQSREAELRKELERLREELRTRPAERFEGPEPGNITHDDLEKLELKRKGHPFEDETTPGKRGR
jgi:septal ring factor EnvC (AmiA/AmiB activator)